MGAGDQLTPGGLKGSWSTKGDCVIFLILTITSQSHLNMVIVCLTEALICVVCFLCSSEFYCLELSAKGPPTRNISHLPRCTDHLVHDKFHELFAAATQLIN